MAFPLTHGGEGQGQGVKRHEKYSCAAGWWAQFHLVFFLPDTGLES